MKKIKELIAFFEFTDDNCPQEENIIEESSIIYHGRNIRFVQEITEERMAYIKDFLGDGYEYTIYPSKLNLGIVRV